MQGMVPPCGTDRPFPSQLAPHLSGLQAMLRWEGLAVTSPVTEQGNKQWRNTPTCHPGGTTHRKSATCLHGFCRPPCSVVWRRTWLALDYVCWTPGARHAVVAEFSFHLKPKLALMVLKKILSPGPMEAVG